MDEPRLKKLCLTVAKADCANNCDGQCIPQGVPCFSYVPACGVCTWFRDAVLPANGPLQSAVLEKMGETPVTGKTCVICGQPFIPGSNRQRYCPDCAKEAYRVANARRVRNHRFMKGHVMD